MEGSRNDVAEQECSREQEPQCGNERERRADQWEKAHVKMYFPAYKTLPPALSPMNAQQPRKAQLSFPFLLFHFLLWKTSKMHNVNIIV